jgi:hypothetical protein
MASGEDKPRIVSESRIGPNVTISVVPRSRVEEEGDPFRPSRKIQRSPTGTRPEVELLEDSEGSIGTSDQGTPVVTRGEACAWQLARRVAANNARAKLARIGTPEEAEDNAREEITTNDIDDEEMLMSRAELKGFTQALTGAVQKLNLLVRGHPKRKETSPVELAIVEERKRPRRAEASYADVCGKVPRIRLGSSQG